MLRARFVQQISLAACLVGLNGCSVDTAQIQEIVNRSGASTNATTGISGELGVSDELQSDSGVVKSTSLQKFVSLTDLPSPGRENAFELSGEFFIEKADSTTSEKKREIFVLGFVEVDHLSVMLSVDGKTEILKKGDTSNGISVLEISPPQARLSLDGVSWYASLFDRRKQ